jgi:hypothetical protein
MEKIILELINLYFEKKNNLFSILEIKEAETLLIKEIVLKTDNPSFLKLNPNSFDFNRILINQIESETGKNTSSGINESFKLIDSFFESKKKKYGYSNFLNAYSEIEDGIKIYLIVIYFDNGTDIIAYYDSLKRKEQLKIHTEIFEALVILDIPFEILLNFLLKHVEKYSIEIISFCTNLCNKNPQKAKAFFEYVNALKYNKKYFHILSRVSIELYPNDNEFYYQNTTILLSKDSTLGYFILGRLKYTSIHHIVDCFRLSEKVNIQKGIDGLLQIPYLYKSLIENKNTTNEVRLSCFAKLGELFIIENETLRNTIFDTTSWISDYEDKKYELLFKVFLQKSHVYYKRLDHFFRQFKNPFYLFHLIGNICVYYSNINKTHNNEIFFESFDHFRSNNYEATKKELINFLANDIPCLRLAAVDLMRTLKPYQMTSLNLIEESEISQLRILEVLFFSSYFNIEQLLDLILSFRLSKHQSVLDYLNRKLSLLILYSYNEYLYNQIEKRTQDRTFLKPLSDALNAYNEMRDTKNGINDLNPIENEKEYMNLYYRLEQENQRKVLNNIDEKNVFSQIAKKSIIVRGNSWKVGDNGVSPLTSHEYSMSFDKTAYKNPDIFNHLKNNFTSEF